MAEYQEWNKEWCEIPKQDWPEAGSICIHKDFQRPLGPVTWIVSKMGDETHHTIQLGLFWRLSAARVFAAAVVQSAKPRCDYQDSPRDFHRREPANG